MFKKFAEAIIAHVVTGVLVSGVTTMAEELLKIDICRKGLVNRKSYSNKVAEK